MFSVFIFGFCFVLLHLFISQLEQTSIAFLRRSMKWLMSPKHCFRLDITAAKKGFSSMPKCVQSINNHKPRFLPQGSRQPRCHLRSHPSWPPIFSQTRSGLLLSTIRQCTVCTECHLYNCTGRSKLHPEVLCARVERLGRQATRKAAQTPQRELSDALNLS